MAGIATTLDFGATFPARPEPTPTQAATSLEFGATFFPDPDLPSTLVTSLSESATSTSPPTTTRFQSSPGGDDSETSINVIGPSIPTSTTLTDPSIPSNISNPPSSAETPWPVYIDISKPTLDSPFSEISSLVACIFGFAAFVVILISALVILRHRQLENAATGPSQAEEARWRRVFGDGYIVGDKRIGGPGVWGGDLEKGFIAGDPSPQKKPVPMLQPLPYVQGRQGPREWIGGGNVARRISSIPRNIAESVGGLLSRRGSQQTFDNNEVRSLRSLSLRRTDTRRSTFSKASSRVSRSVRSLRKKSSNASLRYDHIPSLHYSSSQLHLPTEKVPFDIDEVSPERENTRSPDPLLRKKSSKSSLAKSTTSTTSFKRQNSRHRSAAGRHFHPAGESFMEEDEPSEEEDVMIMPSSHGTMGTLASSSLHSHLPSLSRSGRGWRVHQPEPQVPPLPLHLASHTSSSLMLTPTRR